MVLTAHLGPDWDISGIVVMALEGRAKPWAPFGDVGCVGGVLGALHL